MTKVDGSMAKTLNGETAAQLDLVELLHSRGQRVTSQRLVILRELRRRRQHATAEEIHRSVHEELPGISIPTIYATLDLFVELGLARRIETGIAALYDAGLEPHQHAVCRRCGRVQDVAGGLNADALLGAARASGFQPQGAELIITGLCAECAGAASA
jgi:Fur family ferric uptake transcriptional regulator/Fur family peroxide stress response transcriptional regulator